MSPIAAFWVSALGIATYVILSTELLAIYTSHRMPLPRWIRVQAPRRSRRFMWPNVALVAVIVGLGNVYMVIVATDGSQPLLTRTSASIELVLAAAWSWALIRRIFGGVPRD